MSYRLKFYRGQQRQLLLDFFRYRKLSISSAAKTFSVSKTTIKKWINEERTLPKEVFSYITKIDPKLRRYQNKIEKKLPENWGKIKGGRSRVKNIKDLNSYLWYVRNIKDRKRRLFALRLKQNYKHNNQILKLLITEKIDLYAILAACLLTDGSVSITGNNYRIEYYSKDIILKDFVKALLLTLSSFIPSEILTKEGVYAIRVSDYDLGKKLLGMSPSYKTSPNINQGKGEYLAENQPSLRFLQNATKNTIKWCVRFAFSCDGSISISKRGTPELALSCYHPTLSGEWMSILAQLNIATHFGKSKASWCGITSIRTSNKSNIKKFLDMGGFISGVKISSKSKRYKGFEKNRLLQIAVGP